MFKLPSLILIAPLKVSVFLTSKITLSKGHQMVQEMPLMQHIEAYPVVTSDRRWPCNREDRERDTYFEMFPECRDDPRHNDYGSVTEQPSEGERGGGFFPVLLLLDDGQLCCATRTGATHGANDRSQISLSFSEDRGKTWSDYQIAVQSRPEKGLDYRNPSLGQSNDGHLVLVYGSIAGKNATGPGESHRLMAVIRSDDGGRSWSDPAQIDLPPGAWLNPHGQMRRLSDGTLIFNARGGWMPEVYKRNPELPERISYLYRSSDGGQTWQTGDGIGDGASETGFLPLDENHWVGYVRHNDRPNRIAHSYDGGFTWDRWEESTVGEVVEKSSADIQHAGSWRIVNGRCNKPSPGNVTALPNGKVLITFGHRAYPFGVRAIISHDGGETFDIAREYILSDTGYCTDCGYPSTVCFGDGLIVTVAYSIMDIDYPEWGTCCMAYCYHQEVFE